MGVGGSLYLGIASPRQLFHHQCLVTAQEVHKKFIHTLVLADSGYDPNLALRRYRLKMKLNLTIFCQYYTHTVVDLTPTFDVWSHF